MDGAFWGEARACSLSCCWSESCFEGELGLDCADCEDVRANEGTTGCSWTGSDCAALLRAVVRLPAVEEERALVRMLLGERVAMNRRWEGRENKSEGGRRGRDG